MKDDGLFDGMPKRDARGRFLPRDTPQRPEIRIVYSCSNFSSHYHKWKAIAWLCGRFQYMRAIWRGYD